MLEVALKLLKKIEEHGFSAYVVGGFVRDYVLGIESNDIDVCTNAQPKDIRSIFQEACLPSEDYGSVTVILKNIRFEITTFRKEYSYLNHRKPERFEFINDLHEDLKRRDFLINTLCIDCYGNVLDILNGKEDINCKVIRTVGNSYERFSEDALRILRAVRFATHLQFKLSDEVYQAILDTKHLLKKLSYQRKKEELDKIFTSIHVADGVKLLLELGIDQELELFNLAKIFSFDDLIGIWAELEVDEIYPFTKNEKELMKKIREALKMNNLNHLVLYHYGLYVNSVAAGIKGISKKDVTYQYNSLPIKCRGDICLNGKEISQVLDQPVGYYLKSIFQDLEEKILSLELKNEKEDIVNYLIEKYKNDTL